MPPFFILWRKKISGFYQMGLHPDYRKDPYERRSMGQAVPTVHLTFYRLSAVIRDMSDIHRYSDHSLFSSQPLYTQ